MPTDDDLRHFFETNPQPIFVYDVKTLRILAVNDAFVAEYGYGRDEVLGMDAKQLHPPEDESQFNMIFGPVRSGTLKGLRKMSRPGMRHKRKDGSIFDVETLGQPVSFGGSEAHVVLVRDVSERRKIDALEQRSKAFFDCSRDVLLLLTWDGKIVDANRAALRAYGYPREELLHLKVSDLRDPATLPEVERQIERAQSDGIFFETRHRRRDGSIFPVEVSSANVDIAGERLLLSIVRDTSDRRKAIEEHRGAAARFELLVEQGPDGVVLVRNGRILYANPAFALLAGATDPAQLSGAALADLFSARDRVEVARLVSVRPDQPLSQERELQLRSGKGRELAVAVVARAAELEGETLAIFSVRKARAEPAAAPPPEHARNEDEAPTLAADEQGRKGAAYEEMARALESIEQQIDEARSGLRRGASVTSMESSAKLGRTLEAAAEELARLRAMMIRG